MIILQKMISSISRLQYNSSEDVESNIRSNYRVMFSSNITAKYDISSFRKICSTSSDKNKITPQKDSIFCMGDHNTQKMMTLNKTRLTVAISDLIISEGLSFNLAQKIKFKKVLYLARNVSKFCQHPNKNIKYKDL